MKAAVIYGKDDIRIEERAKPSPANNEVLIKIHACGVCGTDNSLKKGDYIGRFPVVIGHEFSGEIIEVGKDVSGLKQGDRVTADPNRVCHNCFFCQSGQEHLCDNLNSMGVHIDGAVAEYCVMTENNIYQIGDELSYEAAAFTEPLACAIHGVDLAGINLEDTVVILGAGAMGNLILQCVKNSGAANIIVSEPIARRRELALENGATHVFDPFKCDIVQEIKKIKTVGADVVIEVAGKVQVQSDCVSMVRKGGTIEYFGVSPASSVAQLSTFNINENELKILGSFNNKAATSRAVEALVSKRVRVDNLVTHRFPLEKYLDVFEIFGSEETVKLMVNIV